MADAADVMSGVPARFENPRDRAEFKRIHRAGVELYRAHIVEYAFDPHTHEAFGLGAVIDIAALGADLVPDPESLQATISRRRSRWC